jgi:hypothetical protein
MRLRLEEPAVHTSDHDAFDPSPVPVWAEIDFGPWRVGLRLQHRNGQPVLTELRVYTAEPDALPGQWTANVESVPEAGLRPDLVWNLALGGLRDQAIQRLVDPDDPAWEDGWPESWENWYDIAQYAGIDAHADADVPGKPGRQPLSDELLAEVADHYVTALLIGKPTTKYIQEKMDPYAPVGSWVRKARERGFLTEAPKQGQRGGRLTPKTRAVLKRMKDSNEESQ